jgi:hypothetical protein
MSAMITGPSPTDPEERSVDMNGTVVGGQVLLSRACKGYGPGSGGMNSGPLICT